MRKIVILGATGSIGTSVLSVLDAHPGEFEVAGLAAGRASEGLLELAARFPQAMIAVAETPSGPYRQRLAAAGGRGGVFVGDDAAADMAGAADASMCVAAISGTAGMAGAFRAAERGMTVLLANKEVLVSAGRLFMDLAARSGAAVLPLDSEHAALWQCLYGRDRRSVESVTITASGGPFRLWSIEDIRRATAEQALRHPVWNMGAKITVDSASLANKALEVIEARVLYDLDGVGVLVHPQSTVHGLVTFADGSTVAHMGVPDMRQPISHMLFYPRVERWPGGRIDLAEIGRLEFFPADLVKFPMLGIGLEAGRLGGWAPVYYNVANEEAVGMFLRGEIGFGGIGDIVGEVMEQTPAGEPESLGDVLEEQERVREMVRRGEHREKRSS